MREIVARTAPAIPIKTPASMFMILSSTLLQKAESNAARGGPASTIAQLCAALGYRDQAFTWLEKALANSEPMLVFLNVDPAYDNLRSNPRFEELLRRVGLP